MHAEVDDSLFVVKQATTLSLQIYLPHIFCVFKTNFCFRKTRQGNNYVEIAEKIDETGAIPLII